MLIQATNLKDLATQEPRDDGAKDNPTKVPIIITLVIMFTAMVTVLLHARLAALMLA